MDIQINITEEELKKQVESSVEKAIREAVNQIFAVTYNERYYSLLEQVTDRAVEEMPKFFDHEKDRLINATANKLAKGLRISNHEILTALLTIAESREVEK